MPSNEDTITNTNPDNNSEEDSLAFLVDAGDSEDEFVTTNLFQEYWEDDNL